MKKRWITILVSLLVTAVTLYLAFRNVNLPELGRAFASARYEFVIAAALVVALSTIPRGLRWRVLTDNRLTVPDSIWLWNAGFMFNDVLPARLGEIVRAMLAGRKPGMSFTSALSSVVVERLLDVVMVVVLLAIALAGNPLPAWAAQAGLLMAAIAIVGIGGLAWAARHPQFALDLGVKLLSLLPVIDREKARAFLAPFVEGLGGVKDLRIFAGALGYSVLAWAGSLLAAWLVMAAFFPQPPLMVAILALGAAGLGVSVPAAPSGVGPFQAAIIAVMTAINYDLAPTQGFALTMHGVVTLMTIVLGLFGLMREGVSFGEAARQAQQFREQSPSETVDVADAG